MTTNYKNLIKELNNFDEKNIDPIDCTDEIETVQYIESLINGPNEEYLANNERKMNITMNFLKSMGIKDLLKTKEMSEIEFKKTKYSAKKDSYLLKNIDVCKELFRLEKDVDDSWYDFVCEVLSKCGLTVYVRTETSRKRGEKIVKKFYVIRPIKELFKYV